MPAGRGTKVIGYNSAGSQIIDFKIHLQFMFRWLHYYLNWAIVEVAVDAVRSAIPTGFKFKESKWTKSFKIILNSIFLKFETLTLGIINFHALPSTTKHETMLDVKI